MKNLGVFLILLAFLVTACGPEPVSRLVSPLHLGSYTGNRVTVDISLRWQGDDQIWLEARFLPEEGLHLYSKDIPTEGVEGVGRPTLLELAIDSKMKSLGPLLESIPAQPDNEIKGLFTYPVGEVTLSLLIQLPEGEGWFDDEVSITYMACLERICFPPVIGRIIPVQVPGNKETREP